MSRASTITALVLLTSCAAAVTAIGGTTTNPLGSAVVASPTILRLVADPQKFDGTYSGTITNVKHAAQCASQDSWQAIFVVEGNKFHTNIGKNLLAGDVRPDGSFESDVLMGRNVTLHLTGKIDGKALHANAAAAVCSYTWDMQWSKG